MALKSVSKNLNKKDSAKGVFIVRNDRGLHARPSTEIVKCASSFKCDIKLSHQKMNANAKSLLGVLMLAACKGAKISIIASGVDAKEAVNTLLDLADKQFNIKY